jgi:hypothetical protein
VDRVALQLYREYAATRGEMPTLATLRDRLRESGTDEGNQIARDLEIYTVGSLGGFEPNERRRVEPDRRLGHLQAGRRAPHLRHDGDPRSGVDARGAQLRAGSADLALHRRVPPLFANPTPPRSSSRCTSVRKWGLIPTGITQNIEELLGNKSARLMLSNSDFMLLLGQTSTDADSLVDLLHLSDEQRRFFYGVAPGQGLLKSGGAIIPFDARIPQEGTLYNLYQTQFGER